MRCIPYMAGRSPGITLGGAGSTPCINPTTYTKKRRFDLNHPLKDVASKMPLLISLFLPTQKAELSSRKNTRTFQKSPDKIMQCFRSSRGDGNFCQIGHRLNFKPIFQHNWKSYTAVIASTYLQFREICDILGYHRFSEAWFFADYLITSSCFYIESNKPY